MDFKTRKINKRIPRPRSFSKRSFSLKASVIIFITLIVLLIAGIVKAIQSVDYTVILTIAGSDLQEDRYGHTNFLLLGSADEKHEGAFLTDTIIVASLDQKKKIVSMLSIPRDLYVQDPLLGNSRINTVFLNALDYFGSNTEAMEHTKTKVEEIIGMPIHYWARIDFQGFEDLIDAIGGVDIFVEEAIHDPYYPKEGTFLFETFELAAGEHHMDGETALKYARSRKSTSDFDRSHRQQELLYAIKEQTLKTNIILSKDKIESMMSALKKNIDTNISSKEILTLGGLADDLSKDRIVRRLMHDDPTQCGGLLYTPDRRLYEGAFILIPAGGFEYLHNYIELLFYHPEIALEDAKLHILNSTKIEGTAGETLQILERYCIDVIRYGNGKDQDNRITTYYYRQKYTEEGKKLDSRPVALDFLQKLIPGQESTEAPEEYKEYLEKADIILDIGIDYAASPDYMVDPFYYLPVVEYDDDDESLEEESKDEVSDEKAETLSE